MAKKLCKLLIVLLMLTFVCIAFPLSNITSLKSASIEGVSGNKIVLTGLCGSSPQHFFVNDNKESTLVNAGVKEGDDKYYAIVSKGKGTSSGWSDFRPTTDMQTFIEKGLLYAKAYANITTQNNAKVTLKISSGDKTEQVTSSGGEVSTELLKIDDFNNNIRFSFEANCPQSKNDFVMEMPTIYLYTVIDSVTLNEQDQKVAPGQSVNIDAYNDVTQISGVSGNFSSFSKINHKINFDFKSGKDLVKVVGTSLIISDNATEGSQITFRVYSNKTSYNTEKIYSSNYVTLTVDTQNVNIKIRTDFASPAAFDVEETCVPGERIVLNVNPNPNFEFLGWYIDGQLKSKNKKYVIVATLGQDIYAKFKKSISVLKIEAQNRVYDGTTDIDANSVSVVFDGLEKGHEVSLSGASFRYADANVGKDKLIIASYDEIKLIGENSDIYTLKTQNIPNSYGEIEKREAIVTPLITQKEYGNTDTIIGFTSKNVVEGEVLVGNLGRQSGEYVGKYKILQGDLAEKNLNYKIKIEENGAYFEIIQRKISLKNIKVHDKEYDGTTSATVEAELSNVINNEDVKVAIVGEFTSADIGVDKEVKLTSLQLLGKDKNNYILQEYTELVYGNINAKAISVIASDCTFVYGQPLDIKYSAVGLVDGDELQGTLAIENKNVGKHEILIGSLFNPNYYIENFKSAICTITKRTVYVTPDKLFKEYGDEDPILTYTTENLVEGDILTGKLNRSEGEEVGIYTINECSLENANYDVILIENIFEIKVRKITVIVDFFDKEYDGTNNVEFDESYSNNILNENFKLILKAELSDIDCGIVDVQVSEINVETENAENYTFVYEYEKLKVEILRREVNVFVDSFSKIYGDKDPEFTYTTRNLVGNDKLNIKIGRKEGENVGFYSYSLINIDDNKNYNVTLVQSEFEILPKQIRLSVENIYKVFGETDPLLSYKVLDKLCFDDSVEQVIDGEILREQGESVGVYDFDFSNMTTNNNYTFVNVNDTKFVIKKRPVIVTSFASTKIYGEDDPIFRYSVYNDIEGERLTVNILRENGENVGNYSLICGTINDDRYIIEFIPAYLSIRPYTIAIKADEKIKVYGDNDPAFTVSITNGFLRNNDRLDDIISGNLTRTPGENVGDYQIDLGTFSLGNNYNFIFGSGKFSIIKRHVTIKALRNSKIYGNADKSIQYEIGGEGLVYSDTIEGKLEREPGENVGIYKILVGNISLNDNYYFDFVSNDFEILRRRIDIIPTTLSKQYGDEEFDLKYTIEGSLIGNDALTGVVYREKRENQNLGKYRVLSSLYNPNYEVVLDEYYFTIIPREIVIQADNVQIYYGDSDPDLTYKIISGSILNGDKIEGSLRRAKGNSVGSYDIISSLTLGRNYNIKFIKGLVTILPLNLTIESSNYQKTYGQEDPTFDYKIIEGQLINGDKLYGNITRQEGEDIGFYNLLSGVYNENYNITLVPVQLEILKKDVLMISSVYNKNYDGTTRAWLKNPYISGILDDVFLDYDKNNSAEFESAQVGRNIKVYVHDISMIGEKAGNYNLILPEDLHADITLSEIMNKDIKLISKNPVLYEDFTLKSSSFDIKDNIKIQNHKAVLKYNIWLEQNADAVDLESDFIVEICLPKEILNKNNVYVYQRVGNGRLQLLQSSKQDDKIVISTSSLGELYITVEDETWIDYASIVSLAVIGLLVCATIIIVLFKKKKNKKLRK